MDYKQAADVRKKGFANLMTDKLLSGEGIGSSLKNTVSERTKAKVTGIKESFDPLNIAKKITGGSKLGPALVGKMLGRPSEDIKHFTGDEVQNEEKTSSEKVLGQIYDLMIKKREEELRKRGIERNLKEEIDAETQKRDDQLFEAATGEKRGAKPKPRKPKKPSKIKKVAKKGLNIAASVGLLFAAGSRPAEPEEKKTEVKPSDKETPKTEKKTEVKPSDKETPKSTTTSAEKVEVPISTSGVPGLIAEDLASKGVSEKGQANVLAQVKAESNFKPQSENLNYKSADRIQQVFGPRRIPSKEFAQSLVNNPEGLANVVYAKTDGNSEEGDGYKYRGRGFLQHTGKNQYKAISQFTGVDVINNPDKLNEPSIASKAVAWFFLNYKEKNQNNLIIFPK